jgi:hypothetical protein
VAIFNTDYVQHRQELQETVCNICRQVETYIEQLGPTLMQDIVVSLRMCQGIECCSHLLNIITWERSRLKTGHGAASASIASKSTADEDAFITGLGGLDTDSCVGTRLGLDDSLAALPSFQKIQALSGDLPQVMALAVRSDDMPKTVPYLMASECSTARDAVPSFMPLSVPLPAEHVLPSFSNVDGADPVKYTTVTTLLQHPSRWVGGNLSQWFLWRQHTGNPLPPAKVAGIMHCITIEAEKLCSSGLLSLGSIDPDEILMGIDEVPRLQPPALDRPNCSGQRLKWLSPEEAAGQVGGVGHDIWPALSFRLGLLLHCLGGMVSLDPYPERSAEEVFMGLFQEVQGSGPAFRPDIVAFTGPDILQCLVTGCLRIGQVAPPTALVLTSVLEFVATWPS